MAWLGGEVRFGGGREIGGMMGDMGGFWRDFCRGRGDGGGL